MGENAKKDAVFKVVGARRVCGVAFAVYSDDGKNEFFRRREVADALGRVFTKAPEQWEKYYRYGVARTSASSRGTGQVWTRPETGKIEPFLTLEGVYRAFAASRSYFGNRARNRFLKTQEESDLKRLAKAAFKLLAEQGRDGGSVERDALACRDSR